MTENTPPVKQPEPSTAERLGTKKSAAQPLDPSRPRTMSPPQAVDRRDPDRVNQALEHARLAARIADDNRAKDILLLDLRQATPLLDFFVIATATRGGRVMPSPARSTPR